MANILFENDLFTGIFSSCSKQRIFTSLNFLQCTHFMKIAKVYSMFCKFLSYQLIFCIVFFKNLAWLVKYLILIFMIEDDLWLNGIVGVTVL